jgi:Holliday junction resolvase RusA-like endonuclease
MQLIVSLPIRAMGKPAMGKASKRGNWADSPRLQKYAFWQSDFVAALWEAGRPEIPIEGLAIHCEFATRRRVLRGLRKDTKPDCDNISKAVLDSIWGAHGVFAGSPVDDAQVGDEHVSKVWSEFDRINLFHDPSAVDRIAQMSDLVADLVSPGQTFVPNVRAC